MFHVPLPAFLSNILYIFLMLSFLVLFASFTSKVKHGHTLNVHLSQSNTLGHHQSICSSSDKQNWLNELLVQLQGSLLFFLAYKNKNVLLTLEVTQ